jgi:hypothetical protein
MTVLLEKGSHGQLQSQHLPEELKENHKNNSPVVRFGFLKAVLGCNTMPTSKQFVIFQSYYTPLNISNCLAVSTTQHPSRLDRQTEHLTHGCNIFNLLL